MGQVYEEFERELAKWRCRYVGRPKREMVRLCLLALEREELVSIGYREAAIGRRLSRMPIDSEVREIIRQSLLWIWKDEEMHAIYIRGAIFKLGNCLLRARAWWQQLEGSIAGWATSVRQHARWSDAPLSRGIATLLTRAGSVMGKVPEDVWKHLDYGPFRNFCLFNVDAEKTAWLCWHRLIELAETQPDVSRSLVDDFRHVEVDEDRHGRIFEILAAALDEHDRLASGETADSLATKIGAISPFFLSRLRRNVSVTENPLGSGGRVWVVGGTSASDKLPVFRRLLDDAGLAERLNERARFLGKRVEDLRIAIKPTFMLGYHRKDRSPITDPTLLEALAERLWDLGCADVAIVESRNIYDRFFRNRTVSEVARYFDIASPHFRIVDLSEEQVDHAYARGMGQYTVGRTWKEADFRISFAKMRSHSVELVYLTVGNLQGLGARQGEFLFVDRQAQRETSIMMVLDEFPPSFAILDAYYQVPDGLLGMMGCRHSKSPRRFYAGADALAVDLVAARQMGVADPRHAIILRAACPLVRRPDRAIGSRRTEQPCGWLAWALPQRIVNDPEFPRLSGLCVRQRPWGVVRAADGSGSIPAGSTRKLAAPRRAPRFANLLGSTQSKMSQTVLIVGAGMGGLTAAIRLARLGHRVRVLEARAKAGGLAGNVEYDGFTFDAGPYILLDRPGLEWAFHALGLELAEQVCLRRIEDVYDVTTHDGAKVRFLADSRATAAGLERVWPGSGHRYLRFIASMAASYQRLSCLQRAARPGLMPLLRAGAWRDLPLLLRSLRSVLRRTGLPAPAVDAIAIWTHVAGQRIASAPSPLAFVPAVIHTQGAFYPVGGIGTIPRALAAAAAAAGVEFQFSTKVRAIRCERGRVRYVETDDGEVISADAVVSNASGIGTYLELIEPPSTAAHKRLRQLPLQSPGVCAYLAVRGSMRPPYLRFFLPGDRELCRLLVLPGVVAPELCREGWWPARLIAPLDHDLAQREGPAGQRRYLERLLAETWWREAVGEVRILGTRTAAEWGDQYNLYRDSMNPLMTARFMRAGRMAHRSPHVRRLYLAGSSTHPGQWVSFCAISGILAANQLAEDLGGC